MYWIYLIIFVIAVFVPKLVQGDVSVFSEEQLESLLVLLLGTIGFLTYLAKEKALFVAMSEKLRLQKTANVIKRDLSDSYTYIGAMNRKYDIVQDLLFDLPKIVASSSKGCKEACGRLLETARLLLKTDGAAICFVQTRTKKIIEWHKEGVFLKEKLDDLSGESLLRPKKTEFEIDQWRVVRSPRSARGMHAFIVFPKASNHFEDGEVCKILAATALLLFIRESGKHTEDVL